MKRKAKPKRRNVALRLTLFLLALAVLAGAGWCWWVYAQIESYAGQDQAAPSDAIGVFGAAEYDGKPSPVYAIIAETVSRNTEDSARRIAVIARANGLKRLVIVSDGTHLFRIHAICAADGLDVLTSPRPRVAVEGGATGNVGEGERLAHEILSYTAWRLHLH
jgi:hypothetical protein